MGQPISVDGGEGFGPIPGPKKRVQNCDRCGDPYALLMQLDERRVCKRCYDEWISHR